jgi:hypothetical protein
MNVTTIKKSYIKEDKIDTNTYLCPAPVFSVRGFDGNIADHNEANPTTHR